MWHYFKNKDEPYDLSKKKYRDYSICDWKGEGWYWCYEDIYYFRQCCKDAVLYCIYIDEWEEQIKIKMIELAQELKDLKEKRNNKCTI